MTVKTEVPADVLAKKTKPTLRRAADTAHPLVQINFSRKSGELPTNNNPRTRISEMWHAALDDASQGLKKSAYVNIALSFNDLDNGKLTKQQMLDWMDGVAADAQKEGIPIMLQLVAWEADKLKRNGKAFTESEIDALINKYDVIIGIGAVELGIGGSFSLNEAVIVTDWIEYCSNRGLLFVWKEPAYPKDQKAFKKVFTDIAYKKVYDAIVKHKENVILVDKTLSKTDTYFNHSAPFGMWTAGLIGNWGANIESFAWAPYLLVDGEPLEGGGLDKFRLAAFPEAAFGQMMLKAISTGATLLSFEFFDQIIYDHPDTGYQQATAWKYVIRPLLEEAFCNGNIPALETVREKVKVAYQAQEWAAPEISGEQSQLFSGLYAGTLDNSFLPTNGRYYFIPVLPIYFNNPGEIFKSVITPKDFSEGSSLSSLNAKIEYFNSKYPETYSGTGWITKVGSSIYMMNPLENRSSSVSFEGFKLETDFAAEMSGTLSGQTFAYANIAGGSLKILVSNYRSNLYNYKDKLPESYFAREPYPVWRDTHLTEYMKVSAENPDQITHRLTTFTIKGFKTKPVLSVLNKPTETYTVITDEFNNGIYTVTLDHNGPVLLNIKP